METEALYALNQVQKILLKGQTLHTIASTWKLALRHLCCADGMSMCYSMACFCTGLTDL